MPIRIFTQGTPEGDDGIRRLLQTLRGAGLVSSDTSGNIDVSTVVREILEEVRSGGDEAVCRLTSRLDRAVITPETLRVPAAALKAARRSADRDSLALMRRAAENVREYQESIRVQDPPPLRRGGRMLAARYTPIERVGVYVPGGKAFYPSTVIMTVVPAQAAGVKSIAVASPPTGGVIGTQVLALLAELGIDEVYNMGGAVAMAALAYGTETVPRVSKIVGPGNAFVAEAKRRLFGTVGIDSIAGPSEVFIVADSTADPELLAADLLAQAEHDPGSAVLATPDGSLAEAVRTAAENQVRSLSREDALRPALDAYSAIIVTPDLEAACTLANEFAPEHLQIITADDDRCLERINNFGAVFLGPDSPVPLGDYYAGPSHVLPTGGTARFFGPLSCNDFLKSSSIIRYDRSGIREDAADVAAFAESEGLTAHARAAMIRLEKE
jgi:histidinol dehydrogenase